MKKSEIKVGDYYIAKVSNKLTTVKITAIEHRPSTNYMKAGTVYRAVNQSTGREVSFASAASFRGEAEDPTKTTRVIEGTFVTPADEVTNHPDYTKSCDMPAQPGDDKKIGDSNVIWGQLFGRGKPTGGQHSSPQERTAEEEAAHKATLFRLEDEQGSDFIAVAASVVPVTQTVPTKSVANIIKQATQPQLAAPHLIVQARAGTGKTTTLIGGIKVMMGIDPGITPSPQQQAVWDCMALSKGVKSICFVAFNKSIAEELKRRVPVGCEAMTMHGMGFKAVTRAFPKVRVNEHRVDDIIASLLNRDIRDIRRESPVFVSATKQLVNLCKMNLSWLPSMTAGESQSVINAAQSQCAETLNELVDHYDIEFEGTDKAKVFDMVPKVLERCRDVQRDGCIDFSDMIWLPVALNLPVYKYGVLLVDECFPAGTMVETSNGPVAIEKIADSDQNWEVLSSPDQGKTLIYSQVTAAYCTPRHGDIMRIEHEDGKVYCTGNHPIWVEAKGWVPAGLVEVGDSVSYMRDTDEGEEPDLLAKLCKKTSSANQNSRNGGVEKAKNLQAHEAGSKGNSQSDASSRDTRKSVSNSEENWSHFQDSGWQRSGPNSMRNAFASGVSSSAAELAMERRACIAKWRSEGKSSERVTNTLQVGRVISEEDDNCGSGWNFTQQSQGTSGRSTEGKGIVFSRVVSVTVIQQDHIARPGESSEGNCRNVYTLSVKHGCYFANGILVKNCQDLNRCQQELAKRAGQRLILCGDPSQAIYGFAGADSESMKRMGEELEGPKNADCPDCQFGRLRKNGFPCPRCRTTGRIGTGCITLPLTVTRRCGKAIVIEAKKYVKDFEAHESNPAGTISRGAHDINDPNNYRTKVQDGDMILCRCNAPLVSECFKFIKQGRKAVIQGRDIGQGLISTITKMKATSVENLVQKISDWLHREMSKENAKRNPSEARIQALEDRHDCIIVFTEGAKTVDDVITKIDSIFTDNKDTKDIRLSSIHKAKGLEAHRVFWLRLPKTEFVPENESAWQAEQRQNLMYVAVTRAIDELVVVS